MFKLSDDFEDYFESYRDYAKGNKNGIVVRKSIEHYGGGLSILYIAEMFHNGKEFTIGIGDTEDEIEKVVNDFLDNTKHVVQLEQTTEY